MKITLTCLISALSLLVGCTDKTSGGSDTNPPSDDTDLPSDDTGDPTEAIDADGDGWTTVDDCDDSNAYNNPDAQEICDGIDNDCDDQVDEEALGAGTWYADQDGDGYGDLSSSLVACEQPEGYTDDSQDCDDTDAAYNPGALEDDCTDPNDYNCDGFVNFVDEDGDGWAACEDCDDSAATGASAQPGGVETCDGIDNDCNNLIDDDPVGGSTWHPDLDRDGYGDASSELTACDQPEGYTADDQDCNDSDRWIYPGAVEYCDSADNDCDSTIDEDAVNELPWYTDGDSDSYGDPSTVTYACSAPIGQIATAGDCDDTDSGINPGEPEICDEIDQDCDALIDEDPTDGVLLYADADGDTFGDPSALYRACESADGYIADNTDCDDSDAAVNPDAEEICADGIDNDCDGGVDDLAGAVVLYPDSDGDGYGVDGVSVESCESLDGYAADNTDCEDSDASINPGADEICDAVDQDCDELVDEDAADGTPWYVDADEDGYGADGDPLISCNEPEGYADRDGDCDDGDAAYNPGADESDCTDPNDYNCDGSVGYSDADGDGWAACEECDDSESTTYPGAIELCDGLPNDCDTRDTWISDDGIVTLFPESGSTPVDYTTSFSTGSSSAAPEVSISTSGDLALCAGEYYVRPRIYSARLKIIGDGADVTIINGAYTGQGPILISATAAQVSVEGITVTGGDGCFGAVNGMYTSTCALGTIGWSEYTDVQLSITDTVITDNDSPYGYDYYGGGVSLRSGFIDLIDTAIFNNNMNGVFAHDTQVYCEGDSSVAAGAWDNTFYGFRTYDVFYNPSSWTSSECDFDLGMPNGSGGLGFLSSFVTGYSCTTYADDESFYCGESGCDYCP